MTSWLNKQKKQVLLDLSNEAGLKQSDDLRKDEVIENLDTYLQANATRLSRTAAFEPYFGSRRTPFKPRSSSAAGGVTSDDGEVKSVVKARGRRTTKVKQESEDEAGPVAAVASPIKALASAATARTPGRPRRRSELPASPADIADDMEYAASRVYAGIDRIYSKSAIPDTIERIRDMCSSVTGVQVTFLLLEAFALGMKILPWETVTEIESRTIGRLDTPTVPVKLPNFFNLLDLQFWSTLLLWASTSVIVPALFAYFYNLSTRDVKRHGNRVTVARYRIDPLTFSIVKALAAIVVYQQGYTFGGWIHPLTRARINTAMFGGYKGILFGSYVGMLTALYEAAQRK